MIKRKNASQLFYLRNLLLSLIPSSIALGFFIYCLIKDRSLKNYIAAGVLLCLVALMIGLFLYNYIHYSKLTFNRIRKGKVKSYEINSRGKKNNYALIFTIETIDGDEEYKTNYVFSNYSKGKLGLDTYFDKYIEVGYDEKRKEWVVLL